MVYHFDSIGDHNSVDEMALFYSLRWAWEVVHDIPSNVTASKYKEVHVFEQHDTYECGFQVLRTMELHCRSVENHVHSRNPNPIHTCM